MHMLLDDGEDSSGIPTYNHLHIAKAEVWLVLTISNTQFWLMGGLPWWFWSMKASKKTKHKKDQLVYKQLYIQHYDKFYFDVPVGIMLNM